LVAIRAHTDQPAGDAAAAAVDDAHDHLLADVAALGERDGARSDAGLQRDGLGVHVDQELGPASFDPRELQRRRRRHHRTGQAQTRHPAVAGRVRHTDDVAGHAVDVVAQETAGAVQRGIGVLRPAGKRGGVGRFDCGARARQRAGDDLGGANAVNSDRRPHAALVGEQGVLGEDGGVEAPVEVFANRPWHFKRHGVFLGQHHGVGDHPALRGEPRAVTAAADGEADDVVGEQPLEPGGAIAPGHADDAAVAADHDSRAVGEGGQAGGISQRWYP
jgi:hypothetical protein